MRFLCALAVLAYITLVLLDVKATFVNVIFNDELYNGDPLGTEKLPERHMYKLNKNLYKLKKIPKQRKDLLKRFLVDVCGYFKLQLYEYKCYKRWS